MFISSKDDCGSMITNLTYNGPVYLTSPSYPAKYPPNVDCTWTFVEDTPGTFVVTILDLQTESHDYLMIGNGYNISIDNFQLRLFLWHFPRTVIVDEMVMWVWFLTNHAVQYRGFALEVERRNATGKLSSLCLCKGLHPCKLGHLRIILLLLDLKIW